MPLITINQVQKFYGNNHVLKGVDLDIDMGQVISIIGRSGSGKSTLLRCINGLEGYQDGSIKLGGMTITDRDSQAREISRSVGMVFQNFNLFPHMTALENVMLAPRRVLKKSAAECRELAQQMLEKVGLGDRLDYYPSNLSGGQQQRVALARALVNEPAILLLDEPMSALDARLRAQVQVELRNLQRRLGKTFIMVTHDQDEALTVSDRIAVMNNATIVQCGTPVEIYERPKNRFVANFIGDANLFVAKRLGPCEIETEFGRFIMTMPIPWDQGEVIIRPENLRICEDPPPINGVRLKILDSIYLGDHQEIWFHQSGLKAKTHNRTLYPDNTELWVEFLKDGLVPLNEE